MINYITGDLFSAAGGVLAHACNCHEVWGAGVAAVFKRKFPHAFNQYRRHCQTSTPEELLGRCYLIPDGKYTIACLFTNDGCTEEQVLANTKLSVQDMLAQLRDGNEHPTISMPKINAGIFNIPWEKTAKVLETFDYDFNVYVL